jgi:hypothetical protein
VQHSDHKSPYEKAPPEGGAGLVVLVDELLKIISLPGVTRFLRWRKILVLARKITIYQINKCHLIVWPVPSSVARPGDILQSRGRVKSRSVP